MTSRGITQLHRVKLSFCDWGGSSKGIREFFKSDEFYNFINGNKNIFFEIYLRRNIHPFAKAVYANGLEKEISFRNFDKEGIMNELLKLKENCKMFFKYFFSIFSVGRKAQPHAGFKVSGYKKSIQGPWVSNMWNSHPTHGILEFKNMARPKISFDEINPVKLNTKKKLPQTYTRRFGRPRSTFNEI